jgi:uncharacterized membrane protein YraQ (UPF0718 family)
MNFFSNFFALFIESAPWLLLGFFVAGLIKSFVPEDLMSRQLGGRGLWVTVKAALLGAPLPLCSCGVVPAALGLRRGGASKNATVSFLVATPETGVDSIAVSYALLGPVMAVVRPIAAICSGILAGFLVGRSETNELPASGSQVQGQEACCAENKTESVAQSCCASKRENKTTLTQRIAVGLKFSFHDMLRDISFWLLVGLLFAAAVQTWVPESFLTQWGSGFAAFVVMALIGVPMYICATASTPIAAGLLMAGVSPGAVLVFMMAGPATNLGTLAIVGRELGQRALVAYLSGVIIASFVFGYLLDLFVAKQGIDIAAQVHEHGAMEGFVGYIAATVLAIAMLRIVLLSLKARFTRKANSSVQNIATSASATSCCSGDSPNQEEVKSSPTSTSCCSQKSQSAAIGVAKSGCCSSEKDK